MEDSVSNETVVWGVHAVAGDEADNLFLKGNVIAMGFKGIEDMSLIPEGKDGIKKVLSHMVPALTAGAIANYAGQLYRFSHEVALGNMVVYPSKGDKHMHLGRVTGPYRYDPSLSAHYPHMHRVEWLRKVPRTAFSQGALYETGAFLTVFQVKNYAAEFIFAMEHTTPLPPVPVGKDETVGIILASTTENTEDFVRKILSQQLKGHPLAEFVAHLMNLMGYRTEVSPPGTDGGIDVVAYRDELGFQPPIVHIQVKSSDDSVGSPAVQQLQGTLGAAECGLFVTLGTFTAAAKNWAKSKPNIKLIDGDKLIELVLEHYDGMDPRYKSMIPLKRVYLPRPIEG
jgi:restriction system protein